MDETFRIQPVDPALAGVRDALLAQLAGLVPFAEVFEVGSTAVPGVIGKGDLDVLVRVPEERFDELIAVLDVHFVRHHEQFASPIYQGYVLPGPLDVALQCTITGGPHDDFLPFLEALRADPSVVRAYNALKREHDGAPMERYRAAKRAFIEATMGGGTPVVRT